jgi:ABC-2 type transport system ATP-binding protein
MMQNSYDKNYATKSLKGILQHVEGITGVAMKNDIFQIECSRNMVTEISRTIIASGAGLYYLNQKEYGLDDIYYRYFEGGEGHE